MDFKRQPNTNFTPVDALDESEAAAEIEALREGIDHHDHLYYVENRPAISDATYDALFRRLEALEEAFPALRSRYSPTQRVGAKPVGKLARVAHSAPMRSLQAVTSEEEVAAFDRTVRREGGDDVVYLQEPKFDGLSVELVYRNGRLASGSTRGDGETGEDITHNLKTLKTVPLQLRKGPEFLSVRGEVFMRLAGFQQLNRERIEAADEPFANPRNAAAGLMRQLDPRNVAHKPLECFYYEILAVTPDDVTHCHRETLRRLAEWGLRTCPLNESSESLEQIRTYRERLAAERDDLAFEIDGIVIKADDHALRARLGVRARSPRWAVAWKFPPRIEVTTLVDITVGVGRTGILTPVALLQPVEVGGVTVSRATLHNEGEVRRKDVRPGDRVRVVRAGDVIPEILERIDEPGVQKRRSKPFSMPRHCPTCGSRVVRDGAHYRCPADLSCPAQLVGRLDHYASREALDIAQLSEKTAAQLVARGLVRDLADLYRLDVEALRDLDGFANKSARQLQDAIESAKRPRLDQFLYALGIPGVGWRMSRVLAERFRTLDALRGADREALEAIPEIGPELARSVTAFFSEPRNRKVLERLAEAGVKVVPMPSAQERPLRDKVFVFTGSLKDYTRSQASEQVEALGGRVSSSVSGNTDFVVVGTDPGSKFDEAREAGVRCIDEKAFRRLIEDR